MKTPLPILPALLTMLVGLCVIDSRLSTALAQGTAITYQGRLADGASAASGSYDLRFTAFNAGAGGSPVGSAVTTNSVAVSNGLFTATLDFGASVFTGPARWLQIEVKTNGAPSYAILTPRQPLMPAPYAVYAPNAGAAATATTATSATLATTATTANGVAASSVGTAGLADNSVTGAKILDGSVGTADLADNAVTAAKILDGAVGTADLANNAVTSAKVVDASITAADLATDAAGLAKVSGGTMSSSGTSLSLSVDQYLNDKDLLIRGDRNHGVGWYGIGKPFAGVNVDGPVLYGWSGGGLGTFRGGVATNLALTWDASGKVGIGKTNPATALDVNGTVTATAFSGSGAGLTGSLLQANSIKTVSAFINAAAGNTWTKVGDIGDFTVLSGGTVELTYNGRVEVGASSAQIGVEFELRVDGNPTSVGAATGEVLPGERSVRVSITAIYRGLSTGSHKASMWVRPLVGNAADIWVGTNIGFCSLIIKEYK